MSARSWYVPRRVQPSTLWRNWRDRQNENTGAKLDSRLFPSCPFSTESKRFDTGFGALACSNFFLLF